MNLNEIKKLTGKIKLISGLHIGTGNMELHIGGTDSPIAKHPNTSMPYIPGSSIKGKIRSLIELKLLDLNHLDSLAKQECENEKRTNPKAKQKYKRGEVVSIEILKFKDISNEERKNIKNILKLFGSSASNKKDDEAILKEIGPSRLLFQDCFISKEWLEQNKDAQVSEVKSENSINRITTSALSPRFIERVPSGIEFDFSLSIRNFQEDNVEDLLKILKLGLKLLEEDYLGGNGSRGYGKIEFVGLKLDGQDFLYK